MYRQSVELTGMSKSTFYFFLIALLFSDNAKIGTLPYVTSQWELKGISQACDNIRGQLLITISVAALLSILLENMLKGSTKHQFWNCFLGLS